MINSIFLISLFFLKTLSLGLVPFGSYLNKVLFFKLSEIECRKGKPKQQLSTPSFMSMTQIRSIDKKDIAPSIIYLKGKLRGIFVLDHTDFKTSDNTVTVLVTKSGLRYKLQQDGPINIQRFGVIFNNYSAAEQNAIALNKAINSELDIYIPLGDVYTTGVIATTGLKRLSIQGAGLGSRFIHISATDLFDFSSGVSGKIDGITLSASVKMNNNNAALRIKTIKGFLPSITVSNLKITRMGGNLEWGKGLVLVDPDESIVENVVIDGIGDTNEKKKANFRGVEITNTRAAVSSTFRNVKVYGGNEAFYLRNSTNKGIEGVKFFGCDAVGVQIGFDLQSTYDYNQYIPPQILISGCHINAAVYCIKLRNYIQSIISNCDLYAAPALNKLCQAIVGENVSAIKIMSTDIYNVGAGSMYGIVLGGEGTVRAQMRDIIIEMGSASIKNAAVILSRTTRACFVDNINRIGGNQTVANMGTSNIVKNTFNDNTVEVP